MPASGVARNARLLTEAANPLRLARWLGSNFIARCTSIGDILAILWASFLLAARPQSWSPPVRTIFARQLLFSCVDAFFVACRFGAAVGILVIVQAALWIDTLGVGIDTITPMLRQIIIREIAPLLACLVVIGRSGVAISTELATMLVNGEIEVLEAQGIDPMTALVMPRVLGIIISVFCVALILVCSMILTGYAIGWSMGAIRDNWGTFLDSIIRGLASLDLLFFLSKTLVAGGFAGAICCNDGLSVRGTLSDVPRVSSRSGIRALTAVFIVSAVLSILIYRRILVFNLF